MAHSMGGLVTQAYISYAPYAEKVARAITLGTPYWGAPKSHTALLSGKSPR
jgi:triacylglycerol esterase/lipase EstA (alpha/beta hydrolase family)